MFGLRFHGRYISGLFALQELLLGHVLLIVNRILSGTQFSKLLCGFHFLSQKLLKGLGTFAGSGNGDFIDIKTIILGLSHPLVLISALVRVLFVDISIEATTVIFFIVEISMHTHVGIFIFIIARGMAMLRTTAVEVAMPCFTTGALSMLRLLRSWLSNDRAWPHYVDIFVVTLFIAIIEGVSIDALHSNAIILLVFGKFTNAAASLRSLLVLVVPTIMVRSGASLVGLVHQDKARRQISRIGRTRHSALCYLCLARSP